MRSSADERHRFAPRSPASDADRHTAFDLGDGLVEGRPFVSHLGGFFVPAKASRCSSATPARFSSKVKPCSHYGNWSSPLHVDEVEGLLGGTDRRCPWRRCRGRPTSAASSSSARHDLVARTEVVQRRGIDGGGGEERVGTRIMCWGTRRDELWPPRNTALHLRQAELRVVRRRSRQVADQPRCRRRRRTR